MSPAEKEAFLVLQKRAKQKHHGKDLKKDYQSSPSASVVAGSRLYHDKEFMIIISDGDVHPPGVSVCRRKVDEKYVTEILNRKQANETLNIQGLSQAAVLDLKTIAGKIARSEHKELTSLKLDITGDEKPKQYYLDAIDVFIRECKQPGGKLTMCAILVK